MASVPRYRSEGRARAVERRLLSQLLVKRRGTRGGERVGCRHNAPGHCSSSARARALDEAREEADAPIENLEEPSEDLWSKRCHLKLSKSFLPEGLAVDLREQFDRRFEDPRQGDPDRFIWDYWHVPDQYNLLRTPAKAFFSSSSYNALEEALLEYGQKELGCSKMTPLWLSCYVDGCYQGFHADNPHGPWAFVLSLTREDGGGGTRSRNFSGGETTILKPHILEYWRTYDPSAGLESKEIFDTIAPIFNQLTAFDPRLPHSVSKVRGTQDPLEGRLVLHGWFSDPSPFYEGHLEGGMVEDSLSKCLGDIAGDLQQMPPAVGILSVRLHVTPEGSVSDIDWLSDTLVPVPGAPVLALDGAAVEPPEDARQLILEVIIDNIAKLSFPEASGTTRITIPFVFE